jgi:hypothetical protein
MVSIELSDVQGLLVNEYHEMQHSCYVMLQVTDSPKAKEFIRSVAGDITNVTTKTENNCLNIAFTAPGLRALGLKEGKVW